MSKDRRSSSQKHKNLAYVGQKPAFLQALSAQLPHQHRLEDKYGGQDGEEGPTVVKGRDDKPDREEEEEEEGEEEGDEAPQIVVLKEGKHLTATEVKKIQAGDDAKDTTESGPSVRVGETQDKDGRILFRPRKAAAPRNTPKESSSSSASATAPVGEKRKKTQPGSSSKRAKASLLSFSDD
jgi:hypothetical protein